MCTFCARRALPIVASWRASISYPRAVGECRSVARGKHASRTFRLKSEAEAWAREAEDRIERGKSVDAVAVDATTTFSAIIELHIRDLAEVGKPLLRSKAYSLDKLKSDLGAEKLAGLTRERIIAYAKQRARGGAGAATIGMDVGYIQTVLTAAVHGIEVPTEQVKPMTSPHRVVRDRRLLLDASGPRPRDRWLRKP